MDPNDQQTPEEMGTPATPAPEAPETENWQERYANLQPEYTRATQEAAQLRQQLDALKTDPEAQTAFLKELGYEVEADEPEPNQYDDPVSELRQEFEQVKQTLSQQEQERQMAALDAHFNQAFSQFEKTRGGELTDDEKAAIVGLALTMEPDPQSKMPPADKAWESLERIRNAQLEQWAQSKKTPHRVSATGAAGTETPDLDNPQQRQAWMAQRLADLNAG